MAQADGLRLYIHESSEMVCAAKGIHRSGARLRAISAGDFVLSSGSEPVPCGNVVSASAERIDKENWVYRIQYRPLPGTVHPIDGFVVWKQIDAALPESNKAPVIPKAIRQRIDQQPVPQEPAIQMKDIPIGEIGHKQSVPNGRKRKVKVTGQQQGNGTPASVPIPTA